jgi:hypothetical protein
MSRRGKLSAHGPDALGGVRLGRYRTGLELATAGNCQGGANSRKWPLMNRRFVTRDVVSALALKLALLSVLYLLFFRVDMRPAIDAAGVARHLLAPAGLAAQETRDD